MKIIIEITATSPANAAYAISSAIPALLSTDPDCDQDGSIRLYDESGEYIGFISVTDEE